MRRGFVMRPMMFFLCLCLLFAGSAAAGEPARYEYLQEKMAVPVRLVFYAETPEEADAAQEAVYLRFDELNRMMSDYDPESEIVRACRESGETGGQVEIGAPLYEVLCRAREMNRLTDGAFDISVSPIVKLWRRSRVYGQRPPADYLDRAKSLVGNGNWELSCDDGSNPSRFFLRVLQKNVRLDLGGIAKGYAIDEGIRILKERGIRSALIDAGGDIRVTSPPPGKEGWTIGGVSLDDGAQAAYYLTLSDAAIATSGDMFQYFEIDRIRYSHIIDPRSGEPLTASSVVSVIASDAASADALASGISVLGSERGIALAESLPGVEALVITAPSDGTGTEMTVTASGRFVPIRSEILKEREAQ